MADFTSNNTVITAGQEFLVGQAIDTVLNYSPLSLFFLGNQKPWNGVQLRMPVKYAQNTQGMWFKGLEKFSTTKTNNFINMTFNPTGREINTVVNQMEVDVVGTNQVTDIMKRQLASDAQDMASDVATSFWTLQSGDSFLSVLDGIDDGSVLGATTYGGLARATYTGLKGNATSSIGTITRSVLRTMYNSAVHGADKPNLFVTTKTIFGYLETLLAAQQQNVVNVNLGGYPSFVGATKGGLPNLLAAGQKNVGSMGFDSIYYNGTPVIADEVCPSGYLGMLNTRSWGFYGIKTKKEGYKPVEFTANSIDSVLNVPVTTGFSFSGYNTPIDQYGSVGHILLIGNLICNNPRLNSLGIGITGV